MNKVISVIIFILFIFSISYSPQTTKEPNKKVIVQNAFFGCERSPPKLDNENTLSDSEEKYCMPSETQGLISSSQSNIEIPLSYYYDKIFTENWKVRLFGESVSIYAPHISNGGVIEISETLKPLEANENCKFYAFSYKREAGNLKYDFIRKQKELILFDVNNDGKNEIVCQYTYTEELGNKIKTSLTSLGATREDIISCEEYRPLPEDTVECPLTQECKVTISEGQTENYAFTVEKDDCGNKIVGIVNNGLPINLGELNQKALEFSGACLGKYEKQPEKEVCNDGKDNDNDNLIDCLDKDCNKNPSCVQCNENQISCFTQPIITAPNNEKWCCNKLKNNILQKCGCPDSPGFSLQKCGGPDSFSSSYGSCVPRTVRSWNEPDLGIRWLPENDNPPQECNSENSALVIFGDSTQDQRHPSYLVFLNHALSIYHETKAKFGECTFGVIAATSEAVDKVVFPNDKIARTRKFKYLSVITHGSAHGPYIDTGGSFGSLVSSRGVAVLISCQVGKPRILDLFGLPITVENFCTQALPGVKIKVSKTDVEVDIIQKDGDPLFCAIGNFECYECLQQYPPKAKKVQCPN